MSNQSKPNFAKREKEILNLIKEEGFSRKMIAAKLTISINTVDVYLKSIRHKTNTHSIPELLSFLYKNPSLLHDVEVDA